MNHWLNKSTSLKIIKENSQIIISKGLSKSKIDLQRLKDGRDVSGVCFCCEFSRIIMQEIELSSNLDIWYSNSYLRNLDYNNLKVVSLSKEESYYIFQLIHSIKEKTCIWKSYFTGVVR